MLACDLFSHISFFFLSVLFFSMIARPVCVIFLCFLGSVVEDRMLLLPVWHELTSSSQFSGSASHIAGTTGMYVCVYICIYCCVPGAGVICSK